MDDVVINAEEAEGESLRRRMEDGSDLMSDRGSFGGSSRRGSARGEQENPDEDADDEEESELYEVEKFLAVRQVKGTDGDQIEYQIQWEGAAEQGRPDSWQPDANIPQLCREEFEA